MKSSKNEDFKKFKLVTESLQDIKIMDFYRFEGLLKTVFSMNRNGSYRKHNQRTILHQIKSSETIRQISGSKESEEDIVRALARAREVSRND